MGKQKGAKKGPGPGPGPAEPSGEQAVGQELDSGLGSSSTATRKKASRFELLNEGEDVDNDVDVDRDSPQPVLDEDEDEDDVHSQDKAKEKEKETKSKGNKKSKKEKRKKKDDDDEDLDAILADLALEIEGKKPPPKPGPKVLENETKPEDTQPKGLATSEPEKVPVAGVKGPGKGKEQEKAKVKIEPKETSASSNRVEATEDKDKEEAEGKEGKGKKKKKKPEKVDPNVEKSAENEKMDIEEKTGDAVDEAQNEEAPKKGKKGKKDAKDKEKDAKKGPGKRAIALMQETLKKLADEEERIKREEDERIAREEEEERIREEQLRLEKEKKDKKKLKEKERKERLKKEGKFLTTKQKADMQRAKVSLEMMKQQGMIIVGSGRDKAKKQDSLEEKEKAAASAESVKNGTQEVPSQVGSDGQQVENEGTPSDEDVKDTWEDSSDDEEVAKTPPEKTPKVAPVAVKSVLITPKVKASTKNDLNGKLENETRDASAGETPTTVLRSPIICVLGHVDTGKTKLLDYLRKTHVQDNEAGGITQQIGATFVPPSAIREQCRGVKKLTDLMLPGLLIIDTPGHESFTNLRSRGSSLCDIAILVIDIMHGLEPQTIESINLLKSRKTPFVVALNKVDRLYNWESNPRKDIEDVVKSQQTNTRLEFEKRKQEVIVQLNEEALNAALFYENPNPREFVSLVPTSAFSGDGMGNLINLLISYTQTMMSKKLIYEPNRLEATVLEVKAIPGLGTTIDVILVNGKLEEGERIVLAGHEGPVVTQIRSLLVPQPLRELRVKTPYQELKCVYGAMGVKVAGHDLDKAIAGLELNVAKKDADLEAMKADCWDRFGKAMRAIKCSDKGVYVQASTLGSLEALLEFLKVSKIPYCGVRIGPVVKRDVMKASIMLESSPDYAVILAFDVRVERDAQEMADHLGLKIFTAEIIYHLFDKFTAYREELKMKRKEQFRHVAIFPCKLRILPQFIFNSRDPIVVGVSIEDGVVIPGTPLAVPSKENLEIGRVSSIEINHKVVESARRGQEVCLKIDHVGGDAPKLYGRHFDHEDLIVSRITRDSIDAVKEYFRDEMTKTDWQLMIELKRQFEIV